MRIKHLDEAVKMPVKIQRTADDSDLTNNIRKITFPVFVQNVKEYAESLLFNNIPTVDKYGSCLFRFLAFSSYTEIKSARKRYITPSLSVKPCENGYLLIIKSCGISSLNDKYIRFRGDKSPIHPTIYIGNALFTLDSTMEFLEEKLSEEYGTEFKVKMEIVDLGNTGGHVWLDNSLWMADVDVEDYNEAESLIKNAVDMAFPCIPNEYRDIIKNGKTPGTLNLVFEGGVTLQDFADFVKNRVVTPNSINEFNLMILNNSNKNFINSLYEDAQYCAKDLPIKITSLDISKDFYSNLSNYSNDILSKLSNIFSDAGIILPCIAYAFSDSNDISKLTNGLYTADTSRWLENENTQLCNDRPLGSFIYNLIWYPSTNELCYQTNEGTIYNIPREFLGNSGESGNTQVNGSSSDVNEAIKMPALHARKNDTAMPSENIEKITAPVIVEELRGIASKAISKYISEFDIHRQIPIIRFIDQDEIADDGTEYTPDISVVRSGNNYKITIAMLLPVYSNGNIIGGVFYMIAKMFDHIKQDVNSFITDIGGTADIRAKFIKYDLNFPSPLNSRRGYDVQCSHASCNTAADILSEIRETKLIDEKLPFIRVDIDEDTAEMSFTECFDNFIYNYTDQSNINSIITFNTLRLDIFKTIADDFSKTHNLYCANIKYALYCNRFYYAFHDYCDSIFNCLNKEQFGVVVPIISHSTDDTQILLACVDNSNFLNVTNLLKRFYPTRDLTEYNEIVSSILKIKTAISGKYHTMLLMWGSGKIDIACEKTAVKTYKPIRKIIPVEQ